MTCSRCKEAYADGKPDSFGSEPECAFKTDVFDSNNWQCQTMCALRELVDGDADRERTSIWNDDQWAAIVPMPSPKNDEELREKVALGGWDFIILGWYKHRGRTEAAYMLRESEMAPLTLAVAEKVLGEK